jgi:hypothetical protein
LAVFPEAFVGGYPKGMQFGASGPSGNPKLSINKDPFSYHTSDLKVDSTGESRLSLGLTFTDFDQYLDFNVIGANAAGIAPLGNGGGGVFISGSSGNRIGATDSVPNIIAFNSGNAISIDSGTGNTVTSNSIFSNAGLGIDVSTAGSTASTIIDFEDQPDSFANTPFPASYQGVTWTNWKHYAPYTVNGYQPHGVNAIFAAVDGAGFTFPARTAPSLQEYLGWSPASA